MRWYEWRKDMGMSPGNSDKHAPLQLPTWWPEASGDVQFPLDSSLPTASKNLRGHLDALSAAMSSLGGDGLVTAEDVGNWDAGQEFAGTVKNAHEHIGNVYREFQRQLEYATNLLNKSHQNHTAAEEASEKASRLGGESPQHIPTAAPTRQSYTIVADRGLRREYGSQHIRDQVRWASYGQPLPVQLLLHTDVAGGDRSRQGDDRRGCLQQRRPGSQACRP